MSNLLAWALVAITVAFNVYGQMVTKWQVMKAGALPPDLMGRFLFLAQLALNPWMISVFVGLFLTSLCWMGALSRLPLSLAYPFASLSFAIILVLGALFFNEPLNWMKVLGVVFIMLGLFFTSRG